MKVFISWSGDRSRRTARVLRDWLPQVLQAVEPWMSEEDIEKGARSTTEIKLALQDASFGIVCVTRQNVTAPWLNFEAGALSKEVLDARVYVAPFLLDMGPEDIRGPLTDFQVTRNTEADVRRMMATLNGQLPAPLGDGVFDRAFSMWWPELEKQLSEVLEKTQDAPAKPPMNTEEILTEILANVRHTRRVEVEAAVSNARPDARPVQSVRARYKERGRDEFRNLVKRIPISTGLSFSPNGDFSMLATGTAEDFPADALSEIYAHAARYGIPGTIHFPESQSDDSIIVPPF